jgi:putative ABC transport system ATP-binding protein
MISLRGVYKTYHPGRNEVRAVQGVDLDVPPGVLAVIMGPSGSGKSTLLHLIGCLDTPTAGEIQLDETNLSQLTSNERAELRARRVGFVFQKFNLIPNLSAAENVELPMLLAGVPRGEAHAKARAALEQVDLKERIGHRPSELSGGEQQRVAIARALVNDPDVILADEPTGNLDTETGEQVILLLKELKGQGKTAIVVTHNPEVAAIADFLVFMRDGKRVDSLERRRAPSGQVAQEVRR